MNKSEQAAILNSLRQHCEEGVSLAEAASKIRERNPNLSAIDLAQALAATLPSISRQAHAIASRALGDVASDPISDAIEIAAALKAAGYSLNEIAEAIVAPGVYPDLTAYQLGTVLMSPSVFPDTTQAQMRSALQAASFSQADIDSAIALLFPSPVRGPIKDGAILTFKCLGAVTNPERIWLDGRTVDGSVGLAPTTTGVFTGTKWRAHAQGNNVYAFECLGNIVNPQHVWLDGRTVDGSVGLAPNTESPFTGTKWEIVNQSDDTYWLKCLGAIVNPAHVWLSGHPADGSVVLVPTTEGAVSANAVNHVAYQASVENRGWMDEVSDGAVAGTTEQSLRLEAIKIRIPDRHVTYQAHIENNGWMNEVSDGAIAGTTGQGLRMEAIRINVDRGHVYYQAHVEHKGWMDEVSDGAEAGTTGSGLRMEALRIRFEDEPAVSNGTLWQAFPPQYRKIGPQGFTAAPFDDTDAALSLNQPLTKLHVQAGEILDGIQALYGSAQTALPLHGGEGGSIHDFVLDEGDYLTTVSGYYGGWLGGNFILQLTFKTKNGKTYGPCGTMNNAYNMTAFTLAANENEKIVAFFGQASFPPGTVGGYLFSIGITVQSV